MEIKINGETRELDGEAALTKVLSGLGVERKNLAIELNGDFVEDDADWDGIIIKPGDKLEIVRFVGGG
jgi:sulfur carrier protein